MRIIYKNLADFATIAANITSTGSVNNLQNNRKSSIHRSATTVTYTLTWTSAQLINAVALPATNLVTGSTITVNMYANINSTTPHTDATLIDAALERSPIFPDNTQFATASNFSRGGATNSSVWFPANLTQTTRKMEITLSNSRTIDCSRIVCGKYWEPARQVSRGITLGLQDSSEISKTRSGDTYINSKYITESMNFELKYFSDTDRKELLNIFRTWGSTNYIYISVFPDSTNTELSRTYSIYGRSSDISLVYDIASIYTTSLTIESW